MATSGDERAALAGRAAATMEAALDAEQNEADLPTNLAEQLRAGARIAREAADPNLGDAERNQKLKAAMQQLQTPPMVFLPHDVTKAAESARFLVDRALRQA